MNIGTMITQLRVTRGFTQEKVAQALCISRSAYCKWEKNKVSLNLSQLTDLANVYDIKLAALIELIETDNPILARDLFSDTDDNLP